MDGRKLSWDGTSSKPASSTGSFRFKKALKRFLSGSKEEHVVPASAMTVRRNTSPGVFKPDRKPTPTMNNSEYHTSHLNRGKVYVFNHVNFKKDIPTRDGGYKDVENLVKSLPKLGFQRKDIECYQDLTLSQIDERLDEISKEDHSDDDVMMIFVLTHGEAEGKIHAFDRSYGAHDIWERFTADKCPSLKGKPKIFFIIACRGNKVDDGELIRQFGANMRKGSITETDAISATRLAYFRIPIWADFLIVYSTMEGYYSYRNTEDGTWYIQAFCQELNNFEGQYLHFIDFLTAVSRRVASEFTTFTDDPKMNNKKQCPFVTSSLTKVIYLKINSGQKNLEEKKNTLCNLQIDSMEKRPKEEKKNRPRPKSLNV